MVHNGRTLLDYFKVITRSSTHDNIPVKKQENKSSTHQTKAKPSNYFDGCIVIDDDDDDDIQQIEPPQPW
jgi:hypothetical protein